MHTFHTKVFLRCSTQLRCAAWKVHRMWLTTLPYVTNHSVTTSCPMEAGTVTLYEPANASSVQQCDHRISYAFTHQSEGTSKPRKPPHSVTAHCWRLMVQLYPLMFYPSVNRQFNTLRTGWQSKLFKLANIYFVFIIGLPLCFHCPQIVKSPPPTNTARCY